MFFISIVLLVEQHLYREKFEELKKINLILLDKVADVHGKQKNLLVDLESLNTHVTQRDAEHANNTEKKEEENVTNTEFEARISAIKHELGLRMQIAEEQEKNSNAPTLHPQVYNIPAREHDGYINNSEVEIAR